ncbi:MAG: tetratricopeptide repeat protein, partial [Methylocystis sp.]
ANDGAAGTGPWRGSLQKLTAIDDSKIGSLSAPSGFDFASDRAPDPAAVGPSENSWPLQLPKAPAGAASARTGDVQALAEQGDAKAQYELATNLMSGHDPARNAKAAVRWLEKAANQGLALAQLRLGIIYGRGLGVDRNFVLARKWFQAAAENGNALAMHNLAVLLTESRGHAPDHASADVWFRKAAELGIRDSQYNLGVDYMQGLGVERDLVQSYAWFATAAAQGDVEALKKRKEVRALLDAEELDAAKALANSFLQRQPQAQARD